MRSRFPCHGDLGCYGRNEIMTPLIDRMTQVVMQFTLFNAVATGGTPLRRGLMTGKLDGQTRVLRRYLLRVVLRNGESRSGPSTEAAIPVKVEVH